MSGDLALFRRRLLQNPRQVSAIAPSSRHLARAMAEGLGPHTGRVVEFGPGTGRLTQAILDAGLPPSHLSLFELDPDFVRHLQQRFPGVAVHQLAADRADEVTAPGVGAVVSGLPLLSMPAPVRDAILAAAFRLLAPGAPFIQFTYGPMPPVPPETLVSLGLRAEAGRKVWLNAPPARVYRFYRS